MGAADMEGLLKRSFAYLEYPELRGIAATLLQRMPAVPDTYLDKLATLPSSLAHLDLGVQRQVWQRCPQLWMQKMLPLMKRFVQQCPPDDGYDEWKTPERSAQERRGNDATLQDMVTSIGHSQQLYLEVLKVLREGFLTTREVGYCVLRVDLLMSLHDSGMSVAKLDALDPCHQFAWCLDAGLLAGVIDERMCEKLAHYLVAVPANHPVIGDLGMIACSTPIRSLLLTSITRTVREVVSREAFPRDRTELALLTNIFCLGSNAQTCLRSRQFALPALGDDALYQLYPLLAEQIVRAQCGDCKPCPGERLHSTLTQPMLHGILWFFIAWCVQQDTMCEVKRLMPAVMQWSNEQPSSSRTPSFNKFVSFLMKSKASTLVADINQSLQRGDGGAL